MCEPSMPLPSEPRTRLSRVVPHEACFCTSTPGIPYLAKIPFSWATKSGAASVRAMKPSAALVTSGPEDSACTPPTKLLFTAASSAAVPALALRNPRPVSGDFLVVFVVTARPFVSTGRWRPPDAFPLGPIKTPHLRAAGGVSSGSGVASRPVVEPLAPPRGGPFGSLYSRLVPNDANWKSYENQGDDRCLISRHAGYAADLRCNLRKCCAVRNNGPAYSAASEAP